MRFTRAIDHSAACQQGAYEVRYVLPGEKNLLFMSQGALSNIARPVVSMRS
jgi:hypothetical protein